jgi:hypothetical protein
MKILLFIVAAFFVLPNGEGSEVKDPIDIAMDAAMDRNSSTAGMCEAIAAAHEKRESEGSGINF